MSHTVGHRLHHPRSHPASHPRTRPAWRCGGLAVALAWALVTGPLMAQTVEDHSLPRSAIKTWHVKCADGRLALVRYDQREATPRVCLASQTPGGASRCATVPQAQLAQQVSGFAREACR